MLVLAIILANKAKRTYTMIKYNFNKPKPQSSYLALPPVLLDGGHLRPEAVGVEGAVAHVAQEVPVLVAALPAVLAPLALLALPASADDGRDAHVHARVEVVLAALGAVQQVLEAVGGELAHLAVLPRVAVVVQVHRSLLH